MTPNQKPSKFRTIVVDGRTWYWRAGKMWVVARSSDGEDVYTTTLCELTRLTWQEIERLQHKGSIAATVTPEMVAEWIREKAETENRNEETENRK